VSGRRTRTWPDSPAWSPSTRLWVITVTAVIVGALWWQVRGFTSIVVMGVLLAYLLNPLVRLTERAARIGRTLAAGLVYLVVGSVVLLVFVAVAPNVVTTIGGLDIVEATDRALGELVARIPPSALIFGRSIDLQTYAAEMRSDLQRTVSGLFGRESFSWLLGFATDFAFTIFGLFVSFVIALYVSIDTPGLLGWIERVVPPEYRPVYQALKTEIDSVWRRFFRGQLILALVVGLVTTVALVVLGVPYALPLGAAAGVLEVVPRIGPVLATIPAMAVALVSRSTTFPDLDGFVLAIVVGVVYILIQNLENNFLVPRILGESVDLPPVVVLVGALAGAKLAGVPGILLAPPIIGSARRVGGWLHQQLSRPDTPPVLTIDNPVPGGDHAASES
jgi:predicted PurR-regulated permease PerM